MTIPRGSNRVAMLLLALVFMSACFRNSASRGPGGSSSRRIAVEVENNHWATVVVYALINGQRIRMGEVHTGTTIELMTPIGVDPSVVDFRIRVDPIGEREVFDSGSISVQLGDRVLITVENDIRSSRIRIT